MISETLRALEKQLTPVPEKYLQHFSPAVCFLEERREYYIELPGITQLSINNIKFDSKLPEKGIFWVYIENSLGLACIQPMKDGRSEGNPLWVEVYSRKFPVPDEHLAFYQTLVGDLYQQAANLPFTFENITQRGVSEAPRMPTPLFIYHFLRCAVLAFEQASNTILAEPHRVLCDNPKQVMLHQTSEVDADVILSILQSHETWVESNDFYLSRLLQVEGRLYAPERVWQRQPEETYDTPENRFVLHFLRQVLTAADMLPTRSWWKAQSTDGVKKINELASILRQAIAHPMFAEVGDLYHIPFNSQVLMCREGYREIFKLWQQFNSSWQPLFDYWQQAVDVRKIHILYELWVFFKLINLVGESNPCQKVEIENSDAYGVKYLSKAIFQGGEVLIYNQTFHPRWKDCRSYSMVMRPDYIWLGENPSRQVVLDAKFSMSVTEKELENDNEIDGEQNSVVREGYPIRENLYKMHTYRDALVGTQAAVILYPGTETLFMTIEGKKRHHISLKEILSGEMNGIGAIPFSPMK